MRFLIDRCAGHRLAEWLREQGHDVVEARERGPDPGDQEILGWAAAEQCVLVTMDKDFGRLIFAGDRPHCGLIRLPDVLVPIRIALVEGILRDHSQDLLEHAIITVRGERIRISRASS